MNTYLRGEFRLTYAKLGPTEFRLIVMIVCLLLIFVPAIRDFGRPVTIFGNTLVFGVFDYIALFLTAVLGIIWLVTIISDIRYYSKVDPPRKK